MRLLIVRHGDPDYSIDGLTEKGKREAELLADRLTKERIDYAYCSPLGRARLTAEPTLTRLGMEAEICDWLREFSYVKIDYPGYPEGRILWDMHPSYMNLHPELYSEEGWLRNKTVAESGAEEAYRRVCSELDTLLSRHGYLREGKNYRAVRANHDTVVLFCHFGVIAVLLSHLWNTSPYVIWQHLCALPTSVTTVYTEEREEGIASFRTATFGDLSHLYLGGEEPAFAARFCECFTDDTRH